MSNFIQATFGNEEPGEDDRTITIVATGTGFRIYGDVSEDHSVFERHVTFEEVWDALR